MKHFPKGSVVDLLAGYVELNVNRLQNCDQTDRRRVCNMVNPLFLNEFDSVQDFDLPNGCDIILYASCRRVDDEHARLTPFENPRVFSEGLIRFQSGRYFIG